MHRKSWWISLMAVLLFLPMGLTAGDGSIGLKAGVNFSKEGFIAGDTKFQPGLTAGLTYETKKIKFFSFEIGALYHWKRSKAEGFVLDSLTFDTFKTGFHLVEVPVTFKFYIKRWLNLNAGAYVNYLIAAKGEGVDPFGTTNIWNLISDSDFRDDNGDQFLNRLDFGIHFGLEFVTKTGFGFGTKYSQGFGDVTNNSFEWDPAMLNPADNERVKTSSLIAYIFYQF